jgi:hypothetical protein
MTVNIYDVKFTIVVSESAPEEDIIDWLRAKLADVDGIRANNSLINEELIGRSITINKFEVHP